MGFILLSSILLPINLYSYSQLKGDKMRWLAVVGGVCAWAVILLELTGA